MSGDVDRSSTGAREPIALDRGPESGLDSRLLGRDPRRTRIGLSALAAVVVLLAASHATSRAVASPTLRTVAPTVDTVSMFVILVSTAVVLAGPFAYAAWNGGPVLAFAVPVVPIAFGELLAGRYVLGLDATVALTTAAAGGALACYAADVDATGSMRPWRTGAVDGSRTIVALALATGAGAATVRFVLAAPDRLVAAYLPFAPLWLLPVAVAACYAGASFGATGGDGDEPVVAD